jgi:hypothetical protein
MLPFGMCVAAGLGAAVASTLVVLTLAGGWAVMAGRSLRTTSVVPAR